jgi:hypothetical protein
MKTYRIAVRSHKMAHLTVITLRKRGDEIAALDAQIAASGMSPDDFGDPTVFDTKTEDHDVAHKILRDIHGRFGGYGYGRKRKPVPLLRQGAGSQTLLPVPAGTVHMAVNAVLHATTNRDPNGRRKGPGTGRPTYRYF